MGAAPSAGIPGVHSRTGNIGLSSGLLLVSDTCGQDASRATVQRVLYQEARKGRLTRVLTEAEVFQITAATLAEYEQDAESFWRHTKAHDVSQNIAALLRHIEGTHRFTILDFGCGPGRDLKTFTELGHEAVGVEGALRFVEMARAYSGCEVWQQDFLRLALLFI